MPPVVRLEAFWVTEVNPNQRRRNDVSTNTQNAPCRQGRCLVKPAVGIARSVVPELVEATRAVELAMGD